jgi:hypothetical protein
MNCQLALDSTFAWSKPRRCGHTGQVLVIDSCIINVHDPQQTSLLYIVSHEIWNQL